MAAAFPELEIEELKAEIQQEEALTYVMKHQELRVTVILKAIVTSNATKTLQCHTDGIPTCTLCVLRKMLEQSIEELQDMASDLKMRYTDIDAEQNEWKTRFEIQGEVNQQLIKQIEQLKIKVMEGEKMVGTSFSPVVNMEKLLEMTEVSVA